MPATKEVKIKRCPEHLYILKDEETDHAAKEGKSATL